MAAIPRTGRSELTDDELCLLDAMFDRDVAPSTLARELFGESFHLPWSHALDDTGLRAALQGMRGRGLLRTEVKAVESRARIFVGLTASGGEAWSLEREPDWDRYCAESVDERPDRGQVLVVAGGAAEAVRAFLEAARRCGLHLFDPDAVAWSIAYGPLVPWQAARERVVATVPRRGGDAGVRWDVACPDNRWWRTVPELLRLRGGD